VAMSGVTVRPERAVAGRFSLPVAEGGAVVLVRQPNSATDLDALDRHRTRLGVNAGGHLERVTRARFKRATLVFIPDNSAVLAALLDWSVDAVVTDTFEAPLWSGDDEEFTLFGPFTRDRKAYLVRADRPGLAADLDAWLLAREADGSLPELRRQHLGAAHARAVATPLASLLAASDERLALMPLVAAAKRRAVLPLEDPAQEAKVLEAAVVAVAEASQRTAGTTPSEAAVRAFLRAQIEAAKQVQLASGRDPGYEPPERLPDLESELRPALLRIGQRIAALLLALPPGLDASAVHQAARRELRSPWLSEPSRSALADAVVAVSLR
jgi:cyclohexadienyl dehydratase